MQARAILANSGGRTCKLCQRDERGENALPLPAEPAMTRRLAPLALLLLAGCASHPLYTPAEAPPGAASNETIAPAPAQISYEETPGRDAATVARMRATPAPASARIDVDDDGGGDNRLSAQGYVRIGRSRMPVQLIGRDRETDARAEASRQAAAIGAERVLLASPRGTEDAVWIADYYVRFKLSFGATFRDLRAQERTTLAVDGGIAIGTVIGGTPASRANLIAGDYVLAVDGKPIADRADFQDRLKRSTTRSVTLTVIRNGETLQRVVRLGAMADDKD